MNKKRFILTAQDVINLEIKALQKLKKNINNSFNKAVKAIGSCQAKCILVGVGKSGHLASLLASSLSSIGVSSFSLPSASDAAHGDLGAISTTPKKDLVVLISNSGSSSELVPIISYCKKTATTIFQKIAPFFKNETQFCKK